MEASEDGREQDMGAGGVGPGGARGRQFETMIQPVT